MPIFTSSLGSVENLTPQEAVKTMANYIRSMQETLEYRLYNLESGNISEIDTSVTEVRIAGESADKVVESLDESVAELEQAVDSFRAEVRRYGEAVAGYEDEVEELSEQILGYGDDVKEYDAQVASFNQTVNGFNTTVIGYEKTAAGYEAEYSQFNQTAAAIEAEVAEVNGKYTEMKLTVDGLTVTDAGGTTTKIKGSSVETDSLHVKSANIDGKLTAEQIDATELAASALHGNEINLTDASGNIYGQMRASSKLMYIVSGVGSGFLFGGTDTNPVVSCTGKLYAENYEARLLTLETQVATLMRLFG